MRSGRWWSRRVADRFRLRGECNLASIVALSGANRGAAMNYKIRAGQIKERPAFFKPKHVDKETESRELYVAPGRAVHTYIDRWGNLNTFLIASQIEKAEIITEDNKVNFVGAAGWGIVGGVLTGGLGFLAGAVLGGRGKETYCAVRFADGTEMIVSGRPKDVVKLLR